MKRFRSLDFGRELGMDRLQNHIYRPSLLFHVFYYSTFPYFDLVCQGSSFSFQHFFIRYLFCTFNKRCSITPYYKSSLIINCQSFTAIIESLHIYFQNNFFCFLATLLANVRSADDFYPERSSFTVLSCYL